jgi:hypothetical protein
MIDILSKIEKFEFQQPNGVIRPSNIKELISFEYAKGTRRLWITIQSGNRSVPLDLFGLKEDTKTTELFWQNFNNRELQELSSAFEFDLTKVIDTNEDANMSTSVSAAEPIGQTFLKIAIKQNREDGSHYVSVFDYDFPDKTFDGVLYVHGIWQTNFSGEIQKKIETILI